MSGFEHFNTGIDLWMKKVRSMTEDVYRRMVWDLFLMLLRETPQSSGRAVANWNICIGSPNFDFNPNYGDAPTDVGTERYSYGPLAGMHIPELQPAHERGDEKWMRKARTLNRPIKDRIRYTDKVFITNGVLGDEEPGDSQGFAYLEAYMASGQNSWVDKLREVNRGKSVQECVHVVTRKWSTRGHNFNTTRGDRIGGLSMDDL